jgi:hypothetical protein
MTRVAIHQHGCLEHELHELIEFAERGIERFEFRALVFVCQALSQFL